MPFLFKYAVDHLNNAATLVDSVAGTTMTLTTAVLLGCEFEILINLKHPSMFFTLSNYRKDEI